MRPLTPCFCKFFGGKNFHFKQRLTLIKPTKSWNNAFLVPDFGVWNVALTWNFWKESAKSVLYPLRNRVLYLDHSLSCLIRAWIKHERYSSNSLQKNKWREITNWLIQFILNFAFSSDNSPCSVGRVAEKRI